MKSRSGLFLLGTALVFAGCKGGSDNQTSTPAAATATASAPVPGDNATISGVVKFTGNAPAPQKIAMSADAYCLSQHQTPVMSPEVVVNPNGTLQNVYVYVKSGLGDKVFPAPATPAVLDQKGCMYSPHIVAMQVGQDLVVRNSDGVLHNIDVKPALNQPFNIGQPVQGMESKKTFAQPELMIPVKCDVHPWMHCYICVQNNPFASVSGEDGSFSLKNLPAGTYEIEAIHEKYGKSSQTVTIAPNETKTIEFTFKGA